MRELDRGEDFIVTRNGRPVGELRPIRPRQFASTSAVQAALRGAGRVDPDELRADLDRVLDQDPTPPRWRED